MTSPAERNSLSTHSIIFSAAAMLVPRSQRAEWLNDWRSEFWYVRQSRSQARSERPGAHAEALRFCLGAFSDALWVQCDSLKRKIHERFWLQSPLHCLLFLGVIAVALGLGLLYKPWLFSSQLRQPEFIFAQCLVVVLSLLVLPVTRPFALAEHAPASRSRASITRLYRWTFLLLKIGFAVTIAFCVCFYLASLTRTVLFEADGLVAAYVIAFRWTLTDQNRRCPICLRRLTDSAPIGQRCRIFLESRSTKYSCPKSHGELDIPEVPTSFTPRRWRDLAPPPPAIF